MKIKICTIVALLLFAASPALSDTMPFISFEGYKSGTPVGGSIGSQATGPQDPWFGSYAYRYMDGWNHAPRVPAGEYAEKWASGGHAGTGTAAYGWNSLINATPGIYVFDFEGYEFDSNFYYWEDTGYGSDHPKYGHEDRLYQRLSGGSEGTWQILETVGDTSVASGNLGEFLYLDIFYDPLNFDFDTLEPMAAYDPYVASWTTLHAIDDGGLFYDELISRWGTADLVMTMLTEDPPVAAENPSADQIDKWAIYGGQSTVTPVPAPGAVLLGILGLGVAGWKLRRFA